MPISSAKAADSPLPTGRLLTYSDITPQLKGRQAEVRCFSQCRWSLCLRHAFYNLPLSSLLSWLCQIPTVLVYALKVDRRMQLFWPDDKMWYLVEIHSIIPKNRTAKYASGYMICASSACS